FCPGCGTSLVKKCPSCQAQISGSPKFCPECGQRL
ncbi:MAG: zinc ribbon domain-containing protein, partial [Spirochaetales bacterium]|nr:zinc ribbon domain-containing protein [Spirochaetales bacterium]